MSGAGGSGPSGESIHLPPFGDRLRDGSRDITIGASGERAEPLDDRARDLAALAHLVVTCDRLSIESDDKWDVFMYARAIHRRICAVTTWDQPTRPGKPSPNPDATA